MKSSSRRLSRFVAVPTALLLLVAGCSGGEPEGATGMGASPSAEGSATPSASPTAAATELSYPGEEGRTALELLLEADPSAVVEGEGEMAFVTAIGGRAAGESEFWALYVDGEQAQVGAGSLVTEDGQTVTWKLEEVE